MNQPSPRADDTRLWHPFAEMGKVRSSEQVITKAQGIWIWDSEGTRLLDASAALWYSNVGHCCPRIIEAVNEQMAQLDAFSIFGSFANQPALELADRLSTLAPIDDPRVFLGSGGGDAIDTAAKLARRYWKEVGAPQRTVLISRTNGYHGTHGMGTSIAGIEENLFGFGDLVPDVSVVPWDSVDALRNEIARLGRDRVAAFFLEPVIGAGGVLPPPDGYVEGVARVCREAGVLLIVDAVVAGFGRLGTWFGIERWDVEPDMICFAKGVTSGHLPLGGVVVSGQVADPFWQPNSPMLMHGATYAGHPVCCAAALANLDVLEEGDLFRRGQELEGAFQAALLPLAAHPAVKEVRAGLGLVGGVELDPELLARRPQATTEVANAARAAGVLVRPLSPVLAVSPPLIIETDHLEEIAAAISVGLDAVA
jgi:adenosylmethionine-8-amino-7-oxononanoate aminotransferase